jgi:rare lipoprotein A
VRGLAVTVLAAAALAVVMPLTAGDQAHRTLNDAVWRLRGWGNQFIGLDITAVRQNIFSLVRDLDRTVRVVDHDTAHTSYTLGLYNFLTRGNVRTVGDALSVFGIALTKRQADTLELCRPLDSLSEHEEIWVQPDPWQNGVASWYGPGFHGRLAASGEIYNMYEQTAAHKTLPLGSLVRVVSQRTGRSTIVRINDRGPYVAGRIIDMSLQSKESLGMGDLSAVYLERIDPAASHPDCP